MPVGNAESGAGGRRLARLTRSVAPMSGGMMRKVVPRQTVMPSVQTTPNSRKPSKWAKMSMASATTVVSQAEMSARPVFQRASKMASSQLWPSLNFSSERP